MSQARPRMLRAVGEMSGARPVGRVLVSVAVAVAMSFAAGHPWAPVMTGAAAVSGGATTNQFAGGAIPVPPRPV